MTDLKTHLIFHSKVSKLIYIDFRHFGSSVVRFHDFLQSWTFSL